MRRNRGDLREPGGDGLANREQQDGASRASSPVFGGEPQLAVDASSSSGRTASSGSTLRRYGSEVEEAGDWPINREQQDGVGKGGGGARPARPTPISADFVGVSDACTDCCKPNTPLGLVLGYCRRVWCISCYICIYPFKNDDKHSVDRQQQGIPGTSYKIYFTYNIL